MVVVALIGILAAVIGFSLSGGGQATALDSAQRNLMAMIQAAKANAVLEGAPARLIFYSDNNIPTPSDSATVNAKRLRFYGVIYSQTDQNGNVTWTAANQGASLPNGIFFLPNTLSSFATDLPSLGITTPNALSSRSGTNYAYGTMSLPQGFPYNQPQAAGNGGSGETYYYIEFSPSGVFRDPTTGTIANIIIAAADPISDSAVDFHGQATGANQNTNQLLSGVQIRFLGEAPFSSSEDITGRPPGQ